MSDMYLTDQQYLDLLKSIRKDLDSIDKVYAYDSTQIGNKFTETNCGLCAVDDDGHDRHVTEETAMWPKDFKRQGKTEYPYPQQFARKYRKEKHKCPLDDREGKHSDGCFYNCLAFNKKNLSIKEVKRLYDEMIKKVEQWPSTKRTKPKDP